MICGFLFAYFINLIVNKFTPILSVEIHNTLIAIIGLCGGFIPDIDRYESIGFHHRRTLHYPICYGLISLLLSCLFYLFLSHIFLYLTCLFAGAWLHSFMDIFDGFWGEPSKGVYNHITKKWIKAYNVIPFASDKEWSINFFTASITIGISPYLSPLMKIPGWGATTIIYIILGLISVLYEIRIVIPMRKEMERNFFRRIKQRR